MAQSTSQTKPRSEHDRLREIKDQSQTIGEFLDWLQNTKRTRLMVPHEHNEDCDKWCEREFVPSHTSTEKWLAEYFDIDLDKLEREKREILAEIRTHHAVQEIKKELGLK